MKKIIKNPTLLAFELGCIVWIVFAGGILHFAFELSEYWKPMAVFAAVNESVWEHLKMYFWPGLLFALIQYTYTRGVANNYWFGKVAALALTPLIIIVAYEAYIAYAGYAQVKPTLGIMLGIMILGIGIGQFASYKILSAEPLTAVTRLHATAGYAALIFAFSVFTYFPPKVFLFENFACYQYTGEYGILDDYEQYRVFAKQGADGTVKQGGGVNYCVNFKNPRFAREAD